MGKRRANGIILLCLQLLACLFESRGDGREKMRGMFIFGSSLVDNGNNNFLQDSLAKADFFPYGIDFPGGPSGRFTNGKNVVDLLAEMLKLPRLIPPFSDPSTKGSRVIHGVNFASGASGILDETGFVARQVITLNQQIRNFEDITLPELKKQLGCKRGSSELIKNYMFVVGTGGNDYSFNYFLRRGDNNPTLQAFTANLTSSLSLQLKKLYTLGARKFVLMSVNPLGCYPMLKTRRNGSSCIEALNQAATLFNDGLKSLIDVAKSDMQNSSLVFVNSYKIISDIIENPSTKGFKDANNECCEVVPSAQLGGSGTLCMPGGKICSDRSAHVFFDGLHPTEAVNVEIATKAFTSYLQTEVYPINVYQLAKLKH
ncbi:putative zinc finger protein [Hibiscus syriacus]|uniref:Zinc finger protein n=1 Tax=Hibiscus syriacus TaxID=106335 RepID=A0A6A3B3A8_HIBSY|nr:GDSL esterase/lipase At1g29670-like [Hibiscus syriacus]KAE8709815.1 putative zinc finger protein [Hibiscus syriacus]